MFPEDYDQVFTTLIDKTYILPHFFMVTIKRNIMLSLLLWTGLVLFSSFEKSSDDPAMLLTQKPWKMTHLTIGSFSGLPDDCNKDDAYSFKTGDIYTIDSGAAKCDPAEDQVTSGTWKLKENDKVITITAKGETLDHHILELTATTLKVRYTYPVVGVVEETYSH